MPVPTAASPHLNAAERAARNRAAAEGGVRVGIVGAGGAVGRSTALALARLGAGRLRLGARRPGTLPAKVTGAGPPPEIVEVDAHRDDQLVAFCAGCRVIVNCAGPVSRIGPRVAAAALAAGSGYVDPGGDSDLRQQIVRLAGRDSSGAGWVAVIGAGALPGLSGLLPRWLATKGLARPFALTAYVATADQLTPSAAVDYLLSLTDGASGAGLVWRDGRRADGPAGAARQVELPFFAGPMDAYPYLSAETEWLAASLPLTDARWYHVFTPGSRLLATLGRLSGQLRRGIDPAVLGAELVAAAELELAGRRPSQQLVCQLAGRVAGRPATRCAVLRAAGTYRLTGVVAALAARAVLAGTVPDGVHWAAEALDPDMVDELPSVLPDVAQLHLLDQPLATYTEPEYGTI